MSRLRVLIVMLSQESGRNVFGVNHSDIAAHSDFI
jgi:hypothetical protein